jgi:protein-tyrosine-phosphatase/predicted ATP-grasp superfamily ATP-dependent carboligase
MSRSQTGRILLMGDDTRSFLATIRSLGRSGLEVHVAWCPLNAPALRSKYIRQVHRLPEYRQNDLSWLVALNNLTNREQFDLVIPCHDSSILPLHLNRDKLENGDRFLLLDRATFEVFFSKEKTYELGASLGIRLPRQQVIQSQLQLKKAAQMFGFPLVIKPYSSVSAENPWSRQHVSKITTYEELDLWKSKIGGPVSFLAQENFVGIGVGVEVLCFEGEILAAFQHERVHEPLLGGGSSYRKSTSLDSELLEATRKLMKATKYTGVAMAEYKVRRKTRDWILVEINGRFWGSLPLSIAAGVDFPRYLHEMRCLGRKSFPQQYRQGVYCRNWLSDLYWLAANLRADHKDPNLLTVPLGRVMCEILNVLQLRERSDTFVLDDAAPAIAEIKQFAIQIVGGKLRRLRPIRKVMSKEAQNAVRKAQRLLFLCKGNICRSPFADVVSRTLGRESASAGCFPLEHRRCPPAAIQAAKELGVDLKTHRSKIVDKQLVDWADLILIFDDEQRLELEARWPEKLSKVRYLGALEDSGTLAIQDPYGHDTQEFMDTYRRIQRILQSTLGG